MPSFEELMKALKEVGVPTAGMFIIMYVHYKTLVEIQVTIKKISTTLGHMADHVIGKEHSHDND